VWSPDRRRIFFARTPREGCNPRFRDDAMRMATTTIWSMRPNGGEQRQLTPAVLGRSDTPGSVSADGAALAFTRRSFVERGAEGRLPNTNEVWAIRPDGSDGRRLAVRATDPVFSPDGSQIAFVSDKDENGELNYGDTVFFANELYAMNADGSNSRRLTRTGSLNERLPSWLPNGQRIAYQRGKVIQNAEATIVMQANPDGSCPRPVLADPRLRVWYAAPAWRPGDARRGDRSLRCQQAN
jgi:Tol biopolymer transport system component